MGTIPLRSRLRYHANLNHHELKHHNERKVTEAVILNERSIVKNLSQQILVHSVVVASLLRMTELSDYLKL